MQIESNPQAVKSSPEQILNWLNDIAYELLTPYFSLDYGVKSAGERTITRVNSKDKLFSRGFKKQMSRESLLNHYTDAITLYYTSKSILNPKYDKDKAEEARKLKKIYKAKDFSNHRVSGCHNAKNRYPDNPFINSFGLNNKIIKDKFKHILLCIDFDDKNKKHHKQLTEALNIVVQLIPESYVEKSTGGNGWHLYIKTVVANDTTRLHIANTFNILKEFVNKQTESNVFCGLCGTMADFNDSGKLTLGKYIKVPRFNNFNVLNQYSINKYQDIEFDVLSSAIYRFYKTPEVMFNDIRDRIFKLKATVGIDSINVEEQVNSSSLPILECTALKNEPNYSFDEVTGDVYDNEIVQKTITPNKYNDVLKQKKSFARKCLNLNNKVTAEEVELKYREAGLINNQEKSISKRVDQFKTILQYLRKNPIDHNYLNICPVSYKNLLENIKLEMSYTSCGISYTKTISSYPLLIIIALADKNMLSWTTYQNYVKQVEQCSLDGTNSSSLPILECTALKNEPKTSRRQYYNYIKFLENAGILIQIKEAYYNIESKSGTVREWTVTTTSSQIDTMTSTINLNNTQQIEDTKTVQSIGEEQTFLKLEEKKVIEESARVYYIQNKCQKFDSRSNEQIKKELDEWL